MQLEILQYPDGRLRTVAADIKDVTPDIKKLCTDMLETMNVKGGAGLAAPQVGRSLRIFVMVDDEHSVFINPIITERSAATTISDEGCLSFKGFGFIKVKHSDTVTVSAIDIDGKLFSKKYDKLLSQCVQHEMRHLDGDLLIDHLE